MPVKVDTGASSCLFERRFGEQLGFRIESGMRQLFGTATGTFVGYGHEVVLGVAGFEFDTIVFFPVQKLTAMYWDALVGWIASFSA